MRFCDLIHLSLAAFGLVSARPADPGQPARALNTNALSDPSKETSVAPLSSGTPLNSSIGAPVGREQYDFPNWGYLAIEQRSHRAYGKPWRRRAASNFLVRLDQATRDLQTAHSAQRSDSIPEVIWRFVDIEDRVSFAAINFEERLTYESIFDFIEAFRDWLQKFGHNERNDIPAIVIDFYNTTIAESLGLAQLNALEDGDTVDARPLAMNGTTSLDNSSSSIITFRDLGVQPVNNGSSLTSGTLSVRPVNNSNDNNTSLGDPFQPQVYRAGNLVILIDNYEPHLGPKWKPSVYRDLSSRIQHDLEVTKAFMKASDTDPLPTAKWELGIASSQIHFEIYSPDGKGVLYQYVANLAEALDQFSYNWRRTQDVPGLTIFLSDIRYPGRSLGTAKITWFDPSAIAGSFTSNALNETTTPIGISFPMLVW